MDFPRDRFPYSAIVDRPSLLLPGGARLALWTIVNVENWDIASPMPRAVLPPPMGGSLQPDVPNWAWHEYGMRVGFWRLLRCMEQRCIIPTLAINGSVCNQYPRIAAAARDSGWEFIGHGFMQGPMHGLTDQRAAIRATIDAIRTFTGKAPRGWESPGLTETFETLDLLSEQGIEYVADWVLDDQPMEMKTASGSILSLPYTVEMNDVSMMAVQQHGSAEWLERGIRHFDCLYEEAADSMRVMAISVHPYLSGVPHRIKYVEDLFDYILSKPDVLCWTGEQILDWHRSVSC